MQMTTEGRTLGQHKKGRVAAAGATHQGPRAMNQDVFIVNPFLGLYAVLDGMGGHAAGDVAAQTARDELIAFTQKYGATQRFTPRELLEFALDHAAATVYVTATRRPKLAGMGTTAVACLVVDDTHVVIGHAGDSRAYVLRADRLRPLTRDHTIVQEMVEDGQMTPEEAAISPVRNILTRNLGKQLGVHADMLELDIVDGDRILLCSDGLHGCLSPEEITGVLRANADPKQAANALIDATLASETVSDNVSVVVLDFPPL